MTKAAELAKMGEVLTNSQIGGRRNIAINGAMKIAQRSTSETGLGASTGYFTLDRYRLDCSATAGRLTMEQVAVTDLSGFANAMKLTCTTADTSIAAGEILGIRQFFEGQDVQQLKKGTSDAEKFTVSFFVKGNANATYTCEISDTDNTRIIAQEFSVTSSWNRVVLTFDGDTTGVYDDDNARSMDFSIFLHAGSSFTGGTFSSNTYHATDNQRIGDNQTSFFDSTDRTFFFTGLQIEVGSQATPFEHRSYGEELALCQRYCYVINGNLTESAGGPLGMGHMRANNAAYCQVYFPVPMRTYPTSVTVSDVGDFQIVTYGISNNSCTTISIQEITERSALLNLEVSPTPFTVGDGANFTINDTTNGQIIFEGAEL